LEKISAIIWDLDGTLYPNDSAYYNADFTAMAKIASSMGLMDFDAALSAARKSEEEYGGTYEFLINDYGMTHDEIDAIFKKTIDLSFLAPNEGLIRGLRRCAMPMALYSDSPHYWIDDVLARTGLAEFFAPYMRFTPEDFGLHKKGDGDNDFREIVRRLDMPMSEVAYVENTESKLVIPARLGIVPVLLTGTSAYPVAPSVGYRGMTFDNAEGFLRTLN